MKPPRRWTIERMLSADRNALTVFATIRGMARGARQLSPTREAIGRVCSLGDRAIGRAITALHKGQWLNRAYGRQGHRAWYRITLPVYEWFPVVSKTTHRETGRVSPESPQGPFPCGIKKVPPPRRGEGRSTAPALPAGATDPKHQEQPSYVPRDGDPEWVRGGRIREKT